jgi:hypothetical protein
MTYNDHITRQYDSMADGVLTDAVIIVSHTDSPSTVVKAERIQVIKGNPTVELEWVRDFDSREYYRPVTVEVWYMMCHILTVLMFREDNDEARECMIFDASEYNPGNW